jgi:hypothetical protein
MPRKRGVLTAAALAAGSLAGAIVYRRRSSRHEARVDLYYEDGSMVSLAEGSPDAEQLLPLAQGVLDAARS